MKIRSNQGFTLIELILYIGIVSIVLASLVPFAWNMVQGSVKSSNQQELSSQARFISERIKYEIRNANDINNISAESISLAGDPPNNPTVIDLLGGKIRIQQGVVSPIDLNSQSTTVSSLVFVSYTSMDNKTKHIRFSFTIDDAYGGERQEYKAAPLTLESSAELRSN